GSFVPRAGAARFDPNWSGLSQLAGLCAAIELLPEWAYQQSAATAARCRELLAPLVAVESGDATLVAFRPEGDEPAELVRRLAESGVVVREIPGTGLVRVSCGWWTSAGDLERLVAGL